LLKMRKSIKGRGD